MAVSFVVPARNEAGDIGETLGAIRATGDHELIVVDGNSSDATPDIAREHGARVVTDRGTGQGRARHVGALATTGDWLAFVDADTVVRPNYTERLLAFVRERNLAGAGSRCRVTGGWRTRPFELLFNHGLPHLSPPPLPGFNVFVDRAAYFDVGGFRSGPNEDMTFSRRLGRAYPTGVCPAVLVETSGRRMDAGLLATLGHYTRMEFRRQLVARTHK